MFYRVGPSENLLLTRVISSAGILGDKELEALAAEFPAVALKVAGDRTSLRLREVSDVFADRKGLSRLKREIVFMMRIPPKYIGWENPVPICLPFTLTGGGEVGRPFVLHREPAEMVEWLYQAEVNAQAAEEYRRSQIRWGDLRKPLPPLPFMRGAPVTADFLNEEEDF
jgi:hypothetical protein